MRLQFLAKYADFGLLLLRVSVGVIFTIIAAPVLMGGSGRWSRFGSGMRVLGFHSHYAFFGFTGALLLCLAAALIIFGLFFRPGTLFCLLVAIVHAFDVSRGARFGAALLPIELCIVLFSVLLIGPGKYSVDKT